VGPEVIEGLDRPVRLYDLAYGVHCRTTPTCEFPTDFGHMARTRERGRRDDLEGLEGISKLCDGYCTYRGEQAACLLLLKEGRG